MFLKKVGASTEVERSESMQVGVLGFLCNVDEQNCVAGLRGRCIFEDFLNPT